MLKPKLLDLFCKAGGASTGYARAGFEVFGVDKDPQPRYPFWFRRSDALEFIKEHGHEFDVIAASPPCQAFSVTQKIWGREYPDLVEPVRQALNELGKPYVIENVVGAPLINAICLCGTMFGLKVFRHRLFESNCLLLAPGHIKHSERAVAVGRAAKEGEFMTVAGHFASIDCARSAMGIDWMTRAELAQAIPPAYTEFIGRQIIDSVRQAAA